MIGPVFDSLNERATDWTTVRISAEAIGIRDGPAPKKGAHALHTGAYPVVSDSASMRPRNEPPPEPAELFRPAARAEERPTPETTVKVPTVKPVNGSDGRSLAPVPPGADKSDGRSR